MSEKEPDLSKTQREIIEDLQAVADTLDDAPTASQYREHGEFTPGKVQYWFDSWNDGLESAGLEPNQRTTESDEDVLTELKSWVESLDQPPTQELLERDGPYSTHVYIRIAGSFNEALKAAGVKPNRERPIPKESLKADFKRVATDLGHLPTRNEYNEHGRYSPTPFENNWGSWSEVKAAIEVRGVDT